MTENSTPSSFEFYTDYVTKEKALQPEYYNEVQRIIDEHLNDFFKKYSRKPVILDIGSAGMTPYSTELTEKVIIVELFDKPSNVHLPKNVSWQVSNFLDETTANTLEKSLQIDLVIASGLLHHLCDNKNNAISNLNRFFTNLKVFKDANVFIFEGICPHFLAKLQDFIYPVQSFILRKVLRFTNVRIFSMKEILKAISSNNLEYEIIKFKQPKYIAQIFIKVPLFLYPIKIVAIQLSHKKR